jgi:8-oxo-dGTP pyrophosphatase MutT (NUDIX family)
MGSVLITAGFSVFDFDVVDCLHEPKKNSGNIARQVTLKCDMNYTDFSLQVAKIKNLPLPGTSSHYKMVPQIRIQELKARAGKKTNPKKAGVVALFYPDKRQLTNLLLILRNTYPGVHSNQIGFPGGKAENMDKDLLATALRETHEEVGVNPNDIQIIRSLSEIYIPPSNFEVRPYIGLYDKRKPFVKQEKEIEELVEVPLIDFMDDSKMTTQILSTSYAKNIEVPAFKLMGYTVWGATAMMLSEIKELFKQVL